MSDSIFTQATDSQLLQASLDFADGTAWSRSEALKELQRRADERIAQIESERGGE